MADELLLSQSRLIMATSGVLSAQLSHSQKGSRNSQEKRGQ